jgi:predicted ArsR family transcriptional regulator
MTVRPSRQGRRRRHLPQQRDRVRQLVGEYRSPVDAAELAARLGLHVTTVRFHLDALCDQGVIARTRIKRTGVGRPRTGYAAVRGRLDYQSFAEMLALGLGDTVKTRRRRAERAGRRWADRIAAGSPRERVATQSVPEPAGTSASLDRQATMITEVFQRMGFAPELTRSTEAVTGKRQRTIRLHGCPVRELARAHPEVGCAIHLGLLQGLLTNSAAAEGKTARPRPTSHAELEPFVEPELCVAKVIADD